MDQQLFAGVTYTVDDVQRRRPDMTVEEAISFLLQHEALMQALMEAAADAYLDVHLERPS